MKSKENKVLGRPKAGDDIRPTSVGLDEKHRQMLVKIEILWASSGKPADRSKIIRAAIEHFFAQLDV